MPFSFPASPTAGVTTSVQNGRTYIWTGYAWELVAASGSGLAWSSVPASATATGTAGQIAYDAGYQYVCVATNTWKRSSLYGLSAFAPSIVSGLQLWLDASDPWTLNETTAGTSGVSSGSSVKRWQDKSGNARHCTEATNGPTRQVAAINGIDVLRFNGTSNFLQGSVTPVGGNTRTVFVVAKSATSSGQELVQLGIAPASGSFNGFLLRQRYIGSDSFIGGDVRTNNLTVTSTQLPITSTFVACIVQTTNTSHQYFHNATSYTVSGSINSFTADPGYLIGTAKSDSSSTLGYWNGDVCEVLVYDTALSSANRSAVESYLMSKWGIA